jgi:hypothetical protein
MRTITTKNTVDYVIDLLQTTATTTDLNEVNRKEADFLAQYKKSTMIADALNDDIQRWNRYRLPAGRR